jgi:hypothetical protein
MRETLAHFSRRHHMQHDTEDNLPLADNDALAERLPLVEVEALEDHPPSRRKRLAQVGMVLAVALAVFLVFHGALLPSQPPAPTPIPRPTFPPPLALFTSNVNFGAMVINNRAFARQPVLLPITQESYTVTLAASPFRPVTCHISHLSASASDVQSDQRCTVESGSLGLPQMTLNGVTGTPDLVISIALGLDDLPPEQQAAVRAIITSQAFNLRQQTTVPTGDYYAVARNQDGSITSRRATRPLQAELSLVSPLPGQGPTFCGDNVVCPGISDPRVFLSLSGREWLVQVAAALQWRFTTSSGQVMGAATFSFSFGRFRYLSYDEASGWQVDQAASQQIEPQDELDNDNCQAGGDVLQALDQGSGVGYNYDGNTTVEGCLLTIDNGASGQAQLLWRFGVLLAVDQAAHTSFPSLPLAPKDEVAAVGG